MEKIVKDDDDIFAALNDDENTASIELNQNSWKRNWKNTICSKEITNSPQPCEVSKARLVHQVGGEFYLSELECSLNRFSKSDNRSKTDE